ncbi:MAG: hypothetical protein Q9202_004280 [Teloschistes flavicans]
MSGHLRVFGKAVLGLLGVTQLFQSVGKDGGTKVSTTINDMFGNGTLTIDGPNQFTSILGLPFTSAAGDGITSTTSGPFSVSFFWSLLLALLALIWRHFMWHILWYAGKWAATKYVARFVAARDIHPLVRWILDIPDVPAAPLDVPDPDEMILHDAFNNWVNWRVHEIVRRLDWRNFGYAQSLARQANQMQADTMAALLWMYTFFVLVVNAKNYDLALAVAATDRQGRITRRVQQRLDDQATENRDLVSKLRQEKSLQFKAYKALDSVDDIKREAREKKDVDASAIRERDAEISRQANSLLALQRRADDLERKVSGMKEEKKALAVQEEERVKNLTNQNTALAKANGDLVVTIDNLTTQNANLAQANGDLDARKRTLSGSHQRQAAKKRTLAANNKTQAAESTKALQERDQKISTMTTAILDKDTKIASMAALIASSIPRAQHDKILSARDEDEAAMESQVEEQGNKIEELEKEVEELRKQQEEQKKQTTEASSAAVPPTTSTPAVSAAAVSPLPPVVSSPPAPVPVAVSPLALEPALVLPVTPPAASVPRPRSPPPMPISPPAASVPLPRSPPPIPISPPAVSVPKVVSAPPVAAPPVASPPAPVPAVAPAPVAPAPAVVFSPVAPVPEVVSAHAPVLPVAAPPVAAPPVASRPAPVPPVVSPPVAAPPVSSPPVASPPAPEPTVAPSVAPAPTAVFSPVAPLPAVVSAHAPVLPWVSPFASVPTVAPPVARAPPAVFAPVAPVPAVVSAPASESGEMDWEVNPTAVVPQVQAPASSQPSWEGPISAPYSPFSTRPTSRPAVATPFSGVSYTSDSPSHTLVMGGTANPDRANPFAHLAPNTAWNNPFARLGSGPAQSTLAAARNASPTAGGGPPSRPSAPIPRELPRLTAPQAVPPSRPQGLNPFGPSASRARPAVATGSSAPSRTAEPPKASATKKKIKFIELTAEQEQQLSNAR